MTRYLGKVSSDLHRLSSRAHVQIDSYGTDGIPFSVRASLNNYPRDLFKKGAVVEVEQYSDDGRRFLVTNVFEPVRKSVHLTFDIKMPDAESLSRRIYSDPNWKEKTVEKVKFYLNSNYFENPELLGVLGRAFKMTHEEYRITFNQGTGLTFICTTDQFARFLIDRNLNGIKNGFMDLNAKLICSDSSPDAYKLLAQTAGITREQAKKVALTLCYRGPEEILERIHSGWDGDRVHRKLDVSDR